MNTRLKKLCSLSLLLLLVFLASVQPAYALENGYANVQRHGRVASGRDAARHTLSDRLSF